MPYSSNSRSLLTFTFALTVGAIQAAAQTGGGGPTIIFFGSTGALPMITASGVSAEIPYLVVGSAPITCSIDNGVGAVPCSVNGNQTAVSVSPNVTTDYTLTATNSFGSVTAQATVVVLQFPPNPPRTRLAHDAAGDKL